MCVVPAGAVHDAVIVLVTVDGAGVAAADVGFTDVSIVVPFAVIVTDLNTVKGTGS